MTTPFDHLHTLSCPTCGAPLEIQVNEPTIHCQYCNSTVENPEYHPPQPSEPQVITQMDQPTYTPATQNHSRGLGCFIVAVILVVLIGGGVFLATKLIPSSGSGGLSLLPLSPLQIHPPTLLLNSGSPSPNVITGTYDIGSENYALSRLDITSHKALWSALAQKDYLSIDAMLAGDTLLYLVIENRLVALQLNDGKQAWEASLPDKLRGACNACLVLQKGQVLVLTTDNSLGAYDALTGHQTWEKQFDTANNKLYPVGNGVGLVYSMKIGSALGIIDASNGVEVTHIEPTCQPANGMSDEMGTYSNVVFDLSSQPAKVYTFFGLFNACVQRWDLSSATMDWQYMEADQNLDNSNDIPVLLANGELYYVQGDQLRALDTATGTQSQTLDQTQDYNLVPLLVNGPRLVVRAARTKGTLRYELWGYDLTGGQNLWKHPLLKSFPMDPPDSMNGTIDTDSLGWTYQVTSGGLWLITFQTQPNQANLAQVNLDTGELSSQQSLALGIDASTDFYSSPERIPGPDPLAWFTLENSIFALDAQTGKFVYRWP